MLVVFFFFQAEDGIRYLVRSRGLGDVYKRQAPTRSYEPKTKKYLLAKYSEPTLITSSNSLAITPVSYTHLTLPTSDLV